jgi:GTPase SAR1 family protein
MYYRNAQVIVMVFDLTSTHSFKSLEDWRADLEGKADNEVQLFVVGNKADLVGERAIEINIAKAFAEQIEAVEYLETSAKSGQGVAALFAKVAESAQARTQVAFDSLPVVDSAESECKC